MNDLPTIFRRARKSQKLTREELAKQSGVSIQTIGNLERGTRICGPIFLLQLADALGISLPPGTVPKDLEDKFVQTDPTVKAFVSLRMLANSHPDAFNRVAGFMTVKEVRSLTTALVGWLATKADEKNR